MKKKLLTLLVLIIVSVSMIFSATACSTGIFEKDKERDYYQVIGTVQYQYGDEKDEVISKNIYKGQLNSYVYTYGGTYQQNYGMSVENIVEYFYNSLTRNALITLYSKDKIYDIAKTGVAFEYVDIKTPLKDAKPESLLTLGQRLYAMDAANADFNSSFQNYLDKKTSDKDDEDKDEDESDLLEPREVRSYAATASEKYDENSKAKSVSVIYGVQYKDITYGEITKSFIEETLKTTVAEFFDQMTFKSQIKAKIAIESDKTKKANMKDALKDLEKSISDSYLGWDYFYDIQFDSEILSSYQKYREDSKTATPEEIQKLYNTQKKSDIKTYMDVSAYASALSDGKWSIVNPSNDYIGVKSILLKFNSSQENALKTLGSIYAGNESEVKAYRDLIAIGNDNNDIVSSLLKEDEIGIKVNVSNPLYDVDKDKKEDAYAEKDLDYALVLANMADSIAHIADVIVDKYINSTDYKSLNELEKAKVLSMVQYKAKVEAFTQWIYLVNDDPGMFSSERYVITPDGEDTSFVEEFTVLGRELKNAGIGAISVQNRGTLISSKTAEYIGETEGFSTKDYDLYKNNVTSNTKSKELNSDIYTIVTKSGNDISFIINDFGIHVIMVTDIFGTDPFGKTPIVETIDEKTAYVYELEAIKNIDCTIQYDYVYTLATSFDSNSKYYEFKAGEFVEVEITEETFKNDIYYTRKWNLIDVKCEYTTPKKEFEDQIINYLYSDGMTKEQIILYFDAEEGADPKIIKNEKVYKKYLDDLMG